jgi:hypothetical protein
MNIQNFEALQGYMTTENEHWNNWMFEITADAIKGGQFNDIEQALELFSFWLDAATTNHKQPLKALFEIQRELDSKQATAQQALFIWDYLIKYIRNSVFEEGEMTDFVQMAASYAKRIRTTESENAEKPLLVGMREQLNDILNNELQKMPLLLEKLDPEKRLAVLCRLLPLTMPRNETTLAPKQSGFE